MTLAYERIDTPTNSNPAKTGSLLCPAQSPHRQHRRLGLPRLGLCQQRLTLINNHSRSRSRSRSRPRSHLSSYTTTSTHSLRPASRTRKSIPSTEHSSSNKSSRKHTMADSKRNSAFSEADLQDYMMLQNPDLSMWMTAIAIDDDDLTFSGKSLSTWYEEDRRRLSIGDLDEVASREEEHRGRSRERPANRKDTNKQHHKSKSKDSSGHSSS